MQMQILQVILYHLLQSFLQQSSPSLTILSCVQQLVKFVHRYSSVQWHVKLC